ncbi:MAG: roadblock/LC7 domain-containing protein [Candidatus Baldrarchaeia archaeon]
MSEVVGVEPQTLSKLLKEFTMTVPEIEGAALVTDEGLPIVSVLPEGVDETKIAAMTAAILSLGEQTSKELGKGSLEQVYIKGKNGYIIAMDAGSNAVLAVIASSEAKLGLVLFRMEQLAEKISKIISL